MAEPLYEQVADDLRQAILRGDYKPGDRLPPDRELTERYGVSRITMRRAVGMLAAEGLIQGRTSRGTVVLDRRPLTLTASRYERDRGRHDSSAADAYRDELAAQGRQADQRFEMRVIPASARVAERLRVPPSSMVVLRRLVRFVDDRPTSIQDSYYPDDIAAGTEIMSPDDVPRGTIRVLAELGHEEVGHVEEIAVRMPPAEEERRILQLGVSVPVLDQIRTAYTVARPVRLTWTTWAADAIRLVYELGDVHAYHQGE